jgi:F-box-like
MQRGTGPRREIASNEYAALSHGRGVKSGINLELGQVEQVPSEQIRMKLKENEFKMYKAMGERIAKLIPAFMWTPPNKRELPLPEEIIYAKEAIATLENALRDAFELIESTKLRIAEMERDLEERKGWIAPIRKVPTEVLADILLLSSEMDDLTPVKFSAVSRLWRSIILATPKAWSFIDFKRHHEIHLSRKISKNYHGYFPAYMKTYLERSKPRLLHLSLPGTEGFYPRYTNAIIKEQSHRIQCLTTTTGVLNDTQSSSRCQ